MRKRLWDMFIAWLYSAKGMAVVATLCGIGMTALNYLTKFLNEYPIFYGISFGLGVIIALHAYGSIRHFLEAIKTKKETFIEYEIKGQSIVAKATSNIDEFMILRANGHFIFIFKRPMRSINNPDITAIHGPPPTIMSSFVRSKMAYIDLGIPPQDTTFRISFNRQYD